VKVVVDHIKGSRRGQRQELDGRERLSIGRHPKCDVSFDAHRDLDASSRHAELRGDGDRWQLADVGSSNGTFVDGSRVSEIDLSVGEAVLVEFGAGGPQLRIWIGTDDMTPAPFRAGGRATWRWLAVIAAVAAVIALVLLWVAR
jgi:hypothetical protein